MYFNQWNNSKFRYPFAGCLSVSETFSYTWQDIFVLSLLKGKKNGTYLEIGAYYPNYANNTYLLAKDFNWNGVSIDIETEFESHWKNLRPNNTFLCCDALTADYDKILSENYSSNNIDYLQLDIEPSDKTLAALKRIPLDKYRFKVITFETDLYAGGPGPAVREESRQILQQHGYELIFGDVWADGNPYEDWWVDLNQVDRYVALDIQEKSKHTKAPIEVLII